jgi:Tfp pilus assembly protein FimT
MAMPKRMGNISQRGTSITELMVSLAIAALLLVLMGSELQAMMGRVNLEAAISEVEADLRYARTLAIWERQLIQVSIDTNRVNITLIRNGDPTNIVHAPRSLSRRGVRSVHSTGGVLLSFSPRGTSATPTTLTLEGLNGTRRTLTVSLTGIVRVQ